MTKRLWAGLDVGAETTSVCVVNNAGEPVHEASCASDLKSVRRELHCLKRRRSSQIGMEAGIGVHLARGLRELGYTVEVYEARKLSKFLRLRRNKTDAGDANGIAQAGRLGAPMVTRVHVKSLEFQMLGSRLAIRRHLMRTRKAMANLLCRQLELYGGRVRSSQITSIFRRDVEQQIKVLFGKGPSPAVSELRYLLSCVTDLVAHQREIDRALERMARDNEVCRRFMEIPGVGPICALTFYAAVDDPHRFARTSSIGSYLGLTPRIHESGLTQRYGRISKMGHGATRQALVQSALCFKKSKVADPHLLAWMEGVSQRRSKGRANVAMARKLATIMLAMWKSGRPYGSIDVPGLDLDRRTNAQAACRHHNEAWPGQSRRPIGPGRPLFYPASRGRKRSRPRPQRDADAPLTPMIARDEMKGL